MTTITPPNIMINGVAIAMQQYIETRVTNALLQSTESPNPKSDDLTAYRTDEAFNVGVPASEIVP